MGTTPTSYACSRGAKQPLDRWWAPRPVLTQWCHALCVGTGLMHHIHLKVWVPPGCNHHHISAAPLTTLTGLSTTPAAGPHRSLRPHHMKLQLVVVVLVALVLAAAGAHAEVTTTPAQSASEQHAALMALADELAAAGHSHVAARGSSGVEAMHEPTQGQVIIAGCTTQASRKASSHC